MLLFEGGKILKITDMGLSRAVGENSMTDDIRGTFKYMSPGNFYHEFFQAFL